ncbi:uncharacterized protein LOC134275392 [Saccostrea cucullata]|uniref:uncharacterized protein LOC134275392 n=1 Tax=Saccostrea cuccullata TaxID=36930 RepID=UPI002ED1E5D7
MASSSESSDKLREFESLRDFDYQESEMIVRSILDGILDKVCRFFSATEYSVGKEQSVLLQASDNRIKAQKDLYQEQRITAKKIFRRVARETVRDLIIHATKQATTSPNKGQSAIPPFRFANYDTQKLKIQKVKVMIGSEIVHYSLTFSTRRATCAEVASMATQRSLEDHWKMIPKPLYKAPEKTVPDPTIRAPPDCNIPGTATFPDPDNRNEMEDDPEPKGWRRLLCCGNPQKKQQKKEKKEKTGFLSRLLRFFKR